MRASKIFSKINKIGEEIKEVKNILRELFRQKNKNDAVIDELTNIINTQGKVIENLIDKTYAQDTSLQAVLIKPYRGNPRLYKDGKRLDTNSMTGFDISWNWDREIEVTVRNE